MNGSRQARQAPQALKVVWRDSSLSTIPLLDRLLKALPDDPEDPATEFIFDVTSDRKTTYAISVFLPEQATAHWNAAHGRTLSDPEQYAAAKLRLFRAFDEIENVRTDGRRLLLDAPLLEELLATLGLDS